MKQVVCVLCTLLLSVTALHAADDLRGPLAITNVTVVPRPGEQITDAAVLIRDGRIVAVGRGLDLPPGTRVVDGQGGCAYAGFIDGLTRTGVRDPGLDAADERRVEGPAESVSDGPHVSMQAANRHGIFARRRVENLLDIEPDTFDKHRQAGFTTALVAPPSALLGGSASVFDLGHDPLRTSVIAPRYQTGSFTVPRRRELRQRGNYPGTLLGSIAHIRQTLLDADWYGQMRTHVQQHADGASLPYDPDLDRLQHLVGNRGRIVWQAGGQDEIRRALQLLGEFQLQPVIAGGRDAWQAHDALAAAAAPVLISLDLPKEPQKYKLAAGRLSRPPADGTILGRNWTRRPFYPEAAYQEAARQREALLANPQRLAEAGIAWAFCTDGRRNPADSLVAVRAFIDAGLTPDQAVAGLTVSAAEILDVADELGTLEPGKRGSVTVLSAPLGDEDARVTHVVVAGDLFEFPAEPKGRDKDRDSDKNDRPGRKETDGPDFDDHGHGHNHGHNHGHGTADAFVQVSEEDDDANQPDDEDADEAEEDEDEGDDESDDSDVPIDPLRTHVPAWEIETDAGRTADFDTGGSVLLENAHVLTITRGDLENTSILVEDGRIKAIGSTLTAGPDVTRIDLRGYVVMPGMIDPHAHSSVDAINEWTMSVTPEVRIGDVITHDDPVMFWALTGGLTTMHTMHGSANSIGGQNIILKNRYGRSIEHLPLENQNRTIKFALGENVKRPGLARRRSDNGAPRRFPGTRMGVEATMRRALAAGDRYRQDRARHAADRQAGRTVAPFRRDLRLEALADVLDGKLWVNCHCYRNDEILRLLSVAEDFGFRIAALHHVLEGYRVMPELLRHGCGTATFADWWAYKIEAYDAVPQNAGMLLQYGINSTIKSDSDDLIRHMNVEAAKCMKFSDLAPNDALRMVTINAAKLFGIDDRLGSIEVGKDADLAVFSGHPLDTFSRCVMTFVDGRAYFVHPDFDPHDPPPARPIKSFTPASDPAAKTPVTVNVRRDAQPVRPDPDQTEFAITNATLHPVSGPAIPRGTLLIRDGRIAGLGPDVAIPASATIIDARGQHVYPGLINAGTNLGLYEIGAVDVTVDTSGPGTLQPDLMAVSALNPHSAMFEIARAEGITTALIVANGPQIAGQAGLVDLAGWSMPEMLIEPQVGLVVSLPSPSTDPIVPRSRERSRGGNGDDDPLAEIDRFFKDARLYAAARQAGDDDAFPPDARLDAMIPYVMRQRPVLFRATGYRQILEAIQFADRHELQPVIFGGRDAWKLADLLAARDIPVIYEGTFAMPSRVPGLGNVTDRWDGHYRGLATLAEAGVRFCVSRRDADLAKLAATEIGFAVAHGLDPDRAVRALTLDAAEILGLDDRGSLEVGKVANVIVCSDHPAQVTNRIAHVFIRGRHQSTESKHTREAARFAERPAPPLPPVRTDLAGPPSQSSR